MIPDFLKNGNLPTGIHWSTISEIEDKLCFSPKRKTLFNNFKNAILHLKKAGCKYVYLDGSFTTNKEIPNDIDVCWDMNNVNLDTLNKLEPVFFDFDNGRLNQKIKFGCEFFPADFIAKPPTTIYLDFFQEDRDGSKKGIVGLKL